MRSRQPGRCPGPCEREAPAGRCAAGPSAAGPAGAGDERPARSPGAAERLPPHRAGPRRAPGSVCSSAATPKQKVGVPAVQGQPPKTAQCGQAFAAESWRGTTGPRLGGAARRGRQRWGGRPAPPWSSHTRRRSAGKLDSGEARLAANKTLGARGPGARVHSAGRGQRARGRARGRRRAVRGAVRGPPRD